MLFTSSESIGFLNFLSSKEGSIVETVQYLSNKMNLLEKATLHIKEVFPIYQIVMLIYEDTFLTGQSTNDKKNFLKKCFETLFIYSKNLLIRFSFYFDKSVQENVFQDVTYLSQFFSHQNYMSLIGYAFQPNTKDWRFTDNALSPERAIYLQCLTMCFSVGYDYWPNLLRYLNLTVFANHRLSINKLLTENKCDYCDFDLNPNQYLCSVCNSNIGEMSFFDKWHRDLTKTSSLWNLHENTKPKVTYSSLNIMSGKRMINSLTCEHSSDKICDHCASNIQKSHVKSNEETKTDVWICECTYINQNSSLNCEICFRENINRKQQLSERNLNMMTESVISDHSYKNKATLKQIGNNKWECAKCTAWNSNMSWFCEVCLSANEKSENIELTYKSMEITGNNFNPNKYFEPSQPVDLVHSYYSDKIKSEKYKSNGSRVIDLSISQRMKQNTDFDAKNVKDTTYFFDKNKSRYKCHERLCIKILTCILFFYHLIF